MYRIICSMLLAGLAGSASATTITIMPESTVAGGLADRNAWILSTLGPNWNPVMLETFESFGYGPYNSLSTGAGTFSVMPGSQAGDPAQTNGTKTDQFTILNSSDTPFSGRFNTTSGGRNWLDSNDITQLKLTTSQSMLFFFITDVNDCGGILTIKTADETSSSGFATGASAHDGNLYFVGINSSHPIGSVQWVDNSTNDGFGLDDFGTSVDPPPPPPAVPEPSSLAFVAAALIAIPVIKKYRARATAA
jgi:hypothetical protein